MFSMCMVVIVNFSSGFLIIFLLVFIEGFDLPTAVASLYGLALGVYSLLTKCKSCNEQYDIGKRLYVVFFEVIYKNLYLIYFTLISVLCIVTVKH